MAFALGAFTVGAQAALLREYLISFKGSELAFGLMFFFWFFWIALGANLTGKSARLSAFTSRHTALLAALQPVWSLVGLLSLASLRLVSGTPSFAPVSITWLVAGAAWASFAPSFITGLVFPAISRACDESPAAGAKTVYIIESFGAIFGGIAATVAFAMGLSSIVVVAGLGLVQVVAAFVFILQFGRSWGAGRAVGDGPSGGGQAVGDGPSGAAGPSGGGPSGGGPSGAGGQAGPAGLKAFAKDCAVVVLALITCVGLLVPPFGPLFKDKIQQVSLKANLDGAKLQSQIETAYNQVTFAKYGTQNVILVNGEVQASFPAGPEVLGEAALLAAQAGKHDKALILGGDRLETSIALAAYFDLVQMVTLDGELFDIAVRARKDAGLGQLPSNLEVIIEDPRGYAVSSHEPVDLIVIASPEPSTRAAGRMFSVEFLGQLAPKLAGDGALAAFVQSGENALIGETLRYGQSIWQTFSSVFANVAVVPGEEAVILAGHKDANLTTNSGELAQRYLAFTGGKGPYDPRRFSELVQDDRATFVKDAYQANTQQMIHSDTRPLSSFLAMLTSFQRGGSGSSDGLWALFLAGPVVAVIVLLVLVFWLFKARARQGGQGYEFSSKVLITTVGGASIAGSIVMLAQYQAVVGAFHRDIGAASALTMAGLAIGSFIGSRLKSRPENSLFVSLVNACFFFVLPWLLPEAFVGASTFAIFAGLFVALGMITGLAWPVAASLISGQNVAATLESFDHLGAALLAAITGVGLLPLYGTRNTLWILAGLVLLAAISAATDRLLGSQKGKRFLHGRIGRALTHAVWPKSILWPGLLALFAILAVIVPNLGDRTPPGLSPRISHEDIRRIEQAKGIEDFFNPFVYSRLEGTEKGEGIIIATTSVLPDAKGWGGPFNLAMAFGRDGTIWRVQALHHQETSSYVPDLGKFLSSVEGLTIKELLDKGFIDAMTGATVTSKAMSDAILQTSRTVGQELLSLDLPGTPETKPWWTGLTDIRFLYVFATLVGLLIVHRRVGRVGRLVFMAGATLGAVLLDVQLSSLWLQSLVRADFPAWSVTPAFWLLTWGVLVITLFQGPVYCAHACPFGACQEFIGLLGRKIGLAKPVPPSALVRARSLKYMLLVMVIIGTWLSASAIAFDPLTAWMANAPTKAGLMLVIVTAVGALFWYRPWCRFLCPVGAFFNLFNRIVSLLNLAPARAYKNCDLGITRPEDIDCLQCNRCARGGAWIDADEGEVAEHDGFDDAGAQATFDSSPIEGIEKTDINNDGLQETSLEPSAKSGSIKSGSLKGESMKSGFSKRRSTKRTLAFWALIAIFILTVLHSFYTSSGSVITSLGTSPGVRNIDTAEVQRQIESGTLSGHKALYWVPILPGKEGQ